jgi:hypothetical protein
MSLAQDGRGRFGLQVTVGILNRGSHTGDACQSYLLPLDDAAQRLSMSELMSLRNLGWFGGHSPAGDLSVSLGAKMVPVEASVPLNLGLPTTPEEEHARSRQQRRTAGRGVGQPHLRLTIALLPQVVDEDLWVPTTMELIELEDKLTAEQRLTIRDLQPLTLVAGRGEVLLLLTLAFESEPERANVCLPLRLNLVS